MDIEKFYAQRFPRLDRLLRDADMACGPDIWLLATQLLERLEQQGKLPKLELELMPLLRPIFCRTPEEQARFPHLFEQCLIDKNKESVSIATVNRLVSTERGIFIPCAAAYRNLINTGGWLESCLSLSSFR